MNQHELSIASNSNIYIEEEQTEAMEAEEVLEQTQVELAEHPAWRQFGVSTHHRRNQTQGKDWLRGYLRLKTNRITQSR